MSEYSTRLKMHLLQWLGPFITLTVMTCLATFVFSLEYRKIACNDPEDWAQNSLGQAIAKCNKFGGKLYINNYTTGADCEVSGKITGGNTEISFKEFCEGLGGTVMVSIDGGLGTAAEDDATVSCIGAGTTLH